MAKKISRNTAKFYRQFVNEKLGATIKDDAGTAFLSSKGYTATGRPLSGTHAAMRRRKSDVKK